MSDVEKHRTQSDAQRTVASRRTGSAMAEQAILRHLGIELYKEQHRAERSNDEPTEEGPSEGPTDR
ncbi:hypothetical protein [Kribbella speibonae]|uniref:Uncharacterized protein n=1 Tax=Kribbella speibonae TaxID=1572660 RepID=A0A4R0ICF8_9ACTN|nr:hypothetical protein [Kribbella speibonae]TCC30823.1 hypothetical protein E0H92_37565 [Kribbella speibonae]